MAVMARREKVQGEIGEPCSKEVSHTPADIKALTGQSFP